MTLEWILSATALTAVVLVIRGLLGQKMGARLRYGLWLLVLLQLLLPFTVGHSAVSPANFAERAIGPRSSVFGAAANADSPLLQTSEIPAEDSAAGSELLPETVAPTAGSETPADAVPTAASVQLTLSWRSLWMAGMAAAGLWFLLCNGLFYFRLRRSRHLLGHTGSTAVYAADAPSPCLFGLLRPAIYLTPAAQSDPEIRRHVILHERTHLRHGDPLWAFLRTVCLILWWFHPLVWLAAWLSRKDCELCCDDAVVRQLAEAQRVPYGKTLLLLAARKQPVTAFCTVTTLSRSGRQLKERITAISRRVRPKVWDMILAALLALLAMGCAFAGAAADEARETGEAADAADQEPDDGDTASGVSTDDAAEQTEEPARTPGPLTDEDLLLHHGVQLGMTYDEVVSRVGTPSEVDMGTSDHCSFQLDGVYYLFYTNFFGDVYRLYHVQTASNADLLAALDLNIGATLKDLLAALDLPTDLVLDEAEVLYGIETESHSGYLQVTSDGTTDNGYLVSIIAENAGAQFFTDLSGTITATGVYFRGSPKGPGTCCIWDSDLVSPVGSIGTTLDAAEAVADPWEDQWDNGSYRYCSSGNWQYFFRLGDDGVYRLYGWSAGTGEEPLDFHGYTDLSDFLGRLNTSLPEGNNFILHLYGQDGSPLSARLTRQQEEAVISILTESCLLELTFDISGPLQSLHVEAF